MHERRAVARRYVRLQARPEQTLRLHVDRSVATGAVRDCSARRSSSPSTASRACGSRRPCPSLPNRPTNCVSSTACTPTCRTTPRRSSRCTPAAFSSCRPSVGAWTLYGLGSENTNLPGFVTLNPPSDNGGARNYGSGFLPAICQGTKIGTNQIPGLLRRHSGKDQEPGPPLKNIGNTSLTRTTSSGHSST